MKVVSFMFSLVVDAARIRRAVLNELLAKSNETMHDTQVAVKAFVWNPHWECFADGSVDFSDTSKPTECGAKAAETLDKWFTPGNDHLDLDFANLVEVTEKDWVHPKSWKRVSHQCGLDMTALLYNPGRWEPKKDAVHGCMEDEDRPFVMQRFASKTDAAVKVIAVGAHYPHVSEKYPTPVDDKIKDGIKNLLDGDDDVHVLFMADTNYHSDNAYEADKLASTQNILQRLTGQSDVAFITPPQKTCCYDRPTGDQPGSPDLEFDRIGLTGQCVMIEKDIEPLLFQEIPDWAKLKDKNGRAGRFHLPLRAHFEISCAGSP